MDRAPIALDALGAAKVSKQLPIGTANWLYASRDRAGTKTMDGLMPSEYVAETATVQIPVMRRRFKVQESAD